MQLRRITRGQRWIPEIDSLRFVAIFVVLIFHLMEQFDRQGIVFASTPFSVFLRFVIGHGGRGVTLFFVISGFVVALPFARHYFQAEKPVSLRKYFLRRLTRLEPPYLLALLIGFIALIAYRHAITWEMTGHLLASAVYLHSIIFGTLSPVLGVAWSLEVEAQFYVLVPLAAKIFGIRSATLRRVTLVCMILIWSSFSFHFEKSILSSGQYFLAGMLLADLYLLELSTTPKRMVWDLVSLIVWPLAFCAPDSSGLALALPFLYLVGIVAALCGKAVGIFFRNETIAVVGGMCYSIYLLHQLLIAVIFRATKHVGISSSFPETLAIHLLITCVPAVLLCVVYYIGVERPCMDSTWPRRFLKKG